MKKILYPTLLLFGFTLSAQTYVSDTGFGNNGMKFFNAVNFFPQDGMLVDGYYYFLGANRIIELDYSGNLATDFGTQGSLLFTETGETIAFNGWKYVNNYFYAYGKIKNNNNSVEDLFITKFNKDGIPDASFGSNGIKKINLGSESEKISDIIVNTDGSLFCIGSRDLNMVYFRLESNGTLDMSFDANGYKSYGEGLYSSGNIIAKHNDNFLLAGVMSPGAYDYKLALQMVDQSGTPISTFGTNGHMELILSGSGESGSIYNATLQGNDLYVTYHTASSSIAQFNYIARYDISTGTRVFNEMIPYGSFSSSKLKDDGYYVTGRGPCSPSSPATGNCDFKISKRMLANGLPDTGFQGTGEIVYNFPSLLNSNDLACTFIKENDGRIVIAGYSYRSFFNEDTQTNMTGSGFGIVRFRDSSLGNDEYAKSKKIALFPNPAENNLQLSGDIYVKGIILYDMSGRVVKTFYSNDTLTNIDISELQKGTYIAKIETADNSVLLEKIIKK